MQTRRQFLSFIVTIAVVTPTAVAAGCSQSPRPPASFETGREVSPPLGCSELRDRDRQGDCG